MTAEIRTKRDGSHTVEYEVEGTAEEIEAAIKSIHGSYPTPGYGTWFNWPPGKLFTCGRAAGTPNTHLAPTDLGGGRWIARGHRSTSCD